MKYIFGILGLFVLIIAGLVAYSSSIVSSAITSIGTQVLGVSVTVASVDIGFLKGEARIEGLTIQNPEKYTGEKALSLGEIYVKLVPASLVSDKIHIEQVLVKAPEVFYEGDLKSSNFQDIQANLKSGSKSNVAEKETAKSSEGSEAHKVEGQSSPKLQIDVLTIDQAAMHMLLQTPAGEQKADVNIPKVEIKGIGAEGSGATAEEVAQKIVAPFLSQVQSGALGAIRDLGLNGAVDEIKQKGEQVIDRLKNLF